MARIETNTNLVGKTIVLLNGTKAKIEDAIASGYKVKGQTKRIATRCVIKEGAHFKEIERMNMSLLEDTGEGYVKLKDAKAAKASTKKPAAKEKAPKADKKAAKPAKEKEPKVRRKSSKEKGDEYQDLAHAIIKGGKRAAPVEIAEIDADLTDCVAQRLVDVLNNSEVAKLCADNKTPIANAVEVTYGAEFAPETNVMQITLSLQYAKPVQALSRPTLENAEAIALRAQKMAAPKLSMKLKKAIREAFSLEDANDLELGTVLLSDGEEFVYFGESAKHVGKALLYVVETDKFKSVLGSTLGEYEIPDEEDGEEEEEEVEDESEEEEEEDEVEDGEEEDGEEEDDAEYEYVAVNKDQLDMVNKKVTAKYHAALAERFNTTEEVLIPGLMLTDGETTFAYLGCDSKGGLLVIDCGDEGEGEDVLMYSKSDIKQLDDFNPVMGEADEDGEESDAEEDDGEDGDDEEDLDDEEDGDDEEDLDDEEGDDEDEDDNDFDFDDVPEADIEDLTEDELRDRVVEAGLTTPRKADNMDEAKLRKLLKSA
ncbi:hypothetical protein MPK66_gp317 [Erwinia phage pEa_SNUABM_2]|uniref:Uncharacterized protein n=1 Tax=Erwinia phage pEa_SNUABM_2 TaxID=2869547 RepID=A0AAE8C398_9CAUD|nr:hypothetical protein MPK66_gp317 [Erwinia phage pEa_SNUABM_2]QZE59561.1 hypothetical protein pEaSNUABM2_00317 [Erwinia phage pEa_SNUABM_2]QZE59898.1 hypothetical protein pEaSNUABM39_00318 [Erwinia phage pEa_SNUABM_39]